MARLIQSKIKEPLAEKILFGDVPLAGEVQVAEIDDGLVLEFPG